HDGQHRGDVVQVHEGGGQHDRQRTDTHTDNRGEQRQARGHQGAEGEDQDDEGDADADDLTGGLDLDGIAESGAAGLDTHAQVTALVQGIVDGRPVVIVDIFRAGHIDVEGGVTDACVIAEHPQVG